MKSLQSVCYSLEAVEKWSHTVAMVRFRMSLCPDPAWSSLMQEKWWLLKSEASKWTQSYLSHDTESRILSVPVNCAFSPRGAFWWTVIFLMITLIHFNHISHYTFARIHMNILYIFSLISWVMFFLNHCLHFLQPQMWAGHMQKWRLTWSLSYINIKFSYNDSLRFRKF